MSVDRVFAPVRRNLSAVPGIQKPAIDALERMFGERATGSDLTALTARVVIVEADVATLTTGLAAANAAITALTVRVTALEALVPRVSLTASEALAAGDLVNIWTDSGVAKIRKAAVTDDTKPANGFVKAAVLSGAVGVAYLEGVNDALSGLTPGTMYFAAASGGVTASVPGSGWLQIVGRAVSATALAFAPQSGTLL